jgi:hypothetical protein
VQLYRKEKRERCCDVQPGLDTGFFSSMKHEVFSYEKPAGLSKNACKFRVRFIGYRKKIPNWFFHKIPGTIFSSTANICVIKPLKCDIQSCFHDGCIHYSWLLTPQTLSFCVFFLEKPDAYEANQQYDF